ncbi:MAG: ATP-binding protein [Promethearchaeota archaeon]|jgi:ATP-binding protein involved in chromosome partitioning
MEPRTSVIQKRIKKVKQVIAVASGKGGVGKSMVATTFALSLSRMGNQVGLLDLDIYGPSSHIIIGAKPDGFPEEDHGINPYNIAGIRFMSIVYFTNDKPGAFRGGDITNIIIELLAITQWRNLDYLVIDMPPGIGDEVLDVLSYIPEAEFLVITTSSKVAMGPVEKLLKILQEYNVNILGVVENMVYKPSSFVKNKLIPLNIRYLGSIRFDLSIEEAVGKPNDILSTNFSFDLRKIIEKMK